MSNVVHLNQRGKNMKTYRIFDKISGQEVAVVEGTYVTESGLQVWEQDGCCGVIVHKGAEEDISDFLDTDEWELDCEEVTCA